MVAYFRALQTIGKLYIKIFENASYSYLIITLTGEINLAIFHVILYESMI